MKTSTKVLYWVPRVLCILSILFVSMFSLDAFAPGLTVWQQVGGFMMHNIPSFILLAFLILAWRNEIAGGISFIVLGIIFSIAVFLLNYYRNHIPAGKSLLIVVMVSFPFIVVGLLFIWSHYMKKKDLPSA